MVNAENVLGVLSKLEQDGRFKIASGVVREDTSEEVSPVSNLKKRGVILHRAARMFCGFSQDLCDNQVR